MHCCLVPKSLLLMCRPLGDVGSFLVSNPIKMKSLGNYSGRSHLRFRTTSSKRLQTTSQISQSCRQLKNHVEILHAIPDIGKVFGKMISNQHAMMNLQIWSHSRLFQFCNQDNWFEVNQLITATHWGISVVYDNTAHQQNYCAADNVTLIKVIWR